MAEKPPQVEGVMDTQIQVPPPLRAAPQPDLTTNEKKQDAIQACAPAPISSLIVEEPSRPPNTAERKNRPPRIVQERDHPMVTPLEQLDEHTHWIDCPACRRRTKTIATKEGDTMQIVVGILLCSVCPCLACLPCMGHWFENTRITCSACKVHIASISPAGQVQVILVQGRGQRPSVYYQPGFEAK
ncbi:uncharacterized protein F4812DRAFT_425853 [Daldinia caldariorum]|uniref:uncharacterized protein n=1 Tax=Daldinia caldariorum TaxID=326644 RepID=UPI002007D33D|nr:uncharacterized protein F4812DRAFT_425853 [Daldinia caldariorum]KAI1468175.1 hypothetical protein F4812DRAFT_425853 [Daldinia caldariorum]